MKKKIEFYGEPIGLKEYIEANRLKNTFINRRLEEMKELVKRFNLKNLK